VRDTHYGLPPARAANRRARERRQQFLAIRIDMFDRDIAQGEFIAEQVDQASVTQPGDSEIGHATQRDPEV
jgi:hypothetical protein